MIILKLLLCLLLLGDCWLEYIDICQTCWDWDPFGKTVGIVLIVAKVGAVTMLLYQ